MEAVSTILSPLQVAKVEEQEQEQVAQVADFEQTVAAARKDVRVARWRRLKVQIQGPTMLYEHIKSMHAPATYTMQSQGAAQTAVKIPPVFFVLLSQAVYIHLASNCNAVICKLLY